MGFDLVITNAYITMKRHGQNATKRGIHDIIDYDGASDDGFRWISGIRIWRG